MDLTLTEVLDVLLRAEDESGKQRDSAKREAEEDRKSTRLNSSHW